MMTKDSSSRQRKKKRLQGNPYITPPRKVNSLTEGGKLYQDRVHVRPTRNNCTNVRPKCDLTIQFDRYNYRSMHHQFLWEVSYNYKHFENDFVLLLLYEQSSFLLILSKETRKEDKKLRVFAKRYQSTYEGNSSGLVVECAISFQVVHYNTASCG
jgi:hypothetical protein